MKKKYLKALLVLSFLLLLLLFPKASLAGAKSGLLLWFNTVFPTLLPFIIVSNLIIQLNVTDYISMILYPVLHKLLGISKNACYPVLIGMISGYPVGAKACSDLVMENKISKEEGQFLLCFCNNASPMFIISYVTIQSLNLEKHSYLILGVVLLSAFISGFLFRFYRSHFHKNASLSSADASLSIQNIEKEQTLFQLLDSAIVDAFRVQVKIGGYIILFSILAQIVSGVHFLPSTMQFMLIGSLEITTGIGFLAATPLSALKKIVLITALTAFGGFSSLAQTKSVVADSGLSIRTYLIVKLLNAAIAAVMILSIIQIL